MVRQIPVVYRIEGPQPVYEPPPYDWEAAYKQTVEKKRLLYCANGHAPAVEVGPFFICGSTPDMWYITECPRCHTKLSESG